VLLCGGILWAGLWPHTAAAASVAQQFVVHASVAPARYIIVDSAHPTRMVRVLSNTTEAVTPQVYQGSLNGPRLVFSSGLRQQYAAVLAAHPHWGVGALTPEARPVPQLRAPACTFSLTEDEGANVAQHIFGSSQKGVRGVAGVHHACLGKVERRL
jgi:hypothetical protein